MLELPKYIEHCPIIDTLVEIRFESTIHPSAVFGLVYNQLKENYRNVKNLPILQMPEDLRLKDQNLKFKPYHRISNDDFVVQIGPDVITIGSYPKYLGWNKFSNEIFNVLDKIQTLNIVNSFYRVAVRYINFFENDIFRHIELDISIDNKSIDYNNTVIRTEIEHNLFKSSLQIANNANHNNKQGSIIDIDTYLDYDLENLFDRKEELIKEGHNSEKKLFFSLLKKDFLDNLNPKY